MRHVLMIAGLAVALAACASGGESRLGDVSSGFRRGPDADTYGTNRRPDVYGATTAPSLPSIGTSGLGK